MGAQPTTRENRSRPQLMLRLTGQRSSCRRSRTDTKALDCALTGRATANIHEHVPGSKEADMDAGTNAGMDAGMDAQAWLQAWMSNASPASATPVPTWNIRAPDMNRMRHLYLP